MRKYFRIFFKIIKSVFVLLITAYFCFVIIQKFSGNRSVLGYRLFTVATGSMRGVFEINDIIAVKDFNPDNLKVGDDIAYKGLADGFQGMLITHRIIKIEIDSNNNKIFYTKGVNSTVPDPAITKEQILGKVIGVVPIITQFNHIINNHMLFFLFVFLPIVIIIVMEVVKTFKDLGKEKNYYETPIMVIKDITDLHNEE